MVNSSRVLVTGASGFIAMQTILDLLAEGHEVRGTVRSLAKGDRVKETLAPHTDRLDALTFCEADLSSDAVWDEAVAGCEYVQHIASPIPANLPRDPDELIIPARDGALRVLRAARAAGVRRVVMTSSMAAVAYGWGDRRPEILDESHWSDPDNLKDNTAYTRSKTIAERAAWDYVRSDEGAGLELVCINPGAVLGPVLSGDFSASVEIVTQLMSGKLPALPDLGFAIVDVRDVAAAHVSAMTAPGAAGHRYLLSGGYLTFTEVADILREAHPAYARKLPKGKLPSFAVRLLSNVNPTLKQIVPELGKRRQVSTAKAEADLSWTARSPKDAVLTSAETLIAHGVV